MKQYLFCGIDDPGQVGWHFANAAKKMKLIFFFVDSKGAYRGWKWYRRIHWWFLGHRPPYLEKHSSEVLMACLEFRPKVLIATGFAPISAKTLKKIKSLGIVCVNYLTDDPWNLALRAGWFFDSISEYDFVFTTRLANIDDLKTLGCGKVSFLPFAYDPNYHRQVKLNNKDIEKYGCDVAFVGGGDKDRISYFEAMIKAGIKVRVYGGFWDRYKITKPFWGGFVWGTEFRKAISAAKICICLVRQANRDGHVMRTYELAAMKACVLAEDTFEHREIYGDEKAGAVEYFDTIEVMIDKVKRLLGNRVARERMKKQIFNRITTGKNTYQNRLEVVISETSKSFGLKTAKR